MRKLNFTIIMLLIGLIPVITSCEKDDTKKEESYKYEITGTWEWTAVEIQGYKSNLSDLGMSLTITFNSDGTWKGRTTGTPVSFGNGTYTINEKELVIKELGERHVWKIESFKKDEFKVYWSENGMTMYFNRK